MPVWSKPPKDELVDALHGVWDELNNEIIGDPSFEAVVGLPPQRLAEHAIQAVAAYISASGMEAMKPEALIHVYTLGFVVGSKYGEVHARRVPSDHIT